MREHIHTHSYSERLRQDGDGYVLVRCPGCDDTVWIDLAVDHPDYGKRPRLRAATEEDKMTDEQAAPAEGHNGPPPVDDAEAKRLLEVIKQKKEERSAISATITKARSELKAMGFTTNALRRIEVDMGLDADGRAEIDRGYAVLRRVMKFPIDAEGQHGMFTDEDDAS